MNERLGDLLRWLRESLQRDEEMSKTLQALHPTLYKDKKKVSIPQNKSFEELMRALADCMESSIEAIDRVNSAGVEAEVTTDGRSQQVIDS